MKSPLTTLFLGSELNHLDLEEPESRQGIDCLKQLRTHLKQYPKALSSFIFQLLGFPEECPYKTLKIFTWPYLSRLFAILKHLIKALNTVYVPREPSPTKDPLPMTDEMRRSLGEDSVQESNGVNNHSSKSRPGSPTTATDSEHEG